MKLMVAVPVFALSMACTPGQKKAVDASVTAASYLAELDACIEKAAKSSGKYEEYAKCADEIDDKYSIPHNGFAR